MRKFMVLALWALGVQVFAVPLTPEQKIKVEAQLKTLQALGSDAQVVQAVKAFNTAPPKETAGMTQDKWAALTVISPEVKFLSKNDLATYLKGKRTPIIAELFVSGANGQKVAFFGKTSSWSHLGKPKHDQPMKGKTWIGEPELDDSSGKYSVQISFPVLEAGKPIGSIVIGLDMGLLK